MMIALIVAYSKNRVIGKNGQIPWKIKGEQKRFKELTTGNVVIMGRRSFEEIGKPLPNRYTIVVSRTKKYESENCTTAVSLQEAIDLNDWLYGHPGKNFFFFINAITCQEDVFSLELQMDDIISDYKEDKKKS